MAKRPRAANKPINSRIVPPMEALDYTFTDRLTGRTSPYESSLLALNEEPHGSALEYDSIKCLNSLKKAADKLKMKLVFARVGDKVLVKIDGIIDDEDEAPTPTAKTKAASKGR